MGGGGGGGELVRLKVKIFTTHDTLNNTDKSSLMSVHLSISQQLSQKVNPLLASSYVFMYETNPQCFLVSW